MSRIEPGPGSSSGPHRRGRHEEELLAGTGDVEFTTLLSSKVGIYTVFGVRGDEDVAADVDASPRAFLQSDNRQSV